MLSKVLDLCNSHVPSDNPDWGKVRVSEHEYGWIIFVTDFGDETSKRVPGWLLPVWEDALKLDCLLISFDQIGDLDPAFQSWEW